MAILVAAIATACGGGEHGNQPSAAKPAVNAALGGTVVAKVGEVAIDRGFVAAIARARSISAKEALEATIEDALLAEAALRNKAAEDHDLQRQIDAALVRALTVRARARALAEGPFSDQEIAAVASSHPELSRPEGRIAIHVLVRKAVPGAEAIVKEMRERLLGVTAPDIEAEAKAFEESARKTILPAGNELVIETLPPFDEKGRLVGAKGGLELAFAKGAFAVEKASGTSEVVQTSYGFHVIRVLKILPAFEADRGEKLQKLEPELVSARAKKIWDPLLARLRKEGKPQWAATDSDLGAPRTQ